MLNVKTKFALQNKNTLDFLKSKSFLDRGDYFEEEWTDSLGDAYLIDDKTTAKSIFKRNVQCKDPMQLVKVNVTFIEHYTIDEKADF